MQFYAALNTVELAWDRTRRAAEYSTDSTANGSTAGEDQVDYEGSYKYNILTPRINGEVGITLPQAFGIVTPSIVLEEDFKIGFAAVRESTYTKTTYNNTASTSKTTKEEGDTDFGSYINWYNTLTPKFTFDFDLGDRFTFKTRLQAGLGFGHQYSEVGKATTTTRTTNSAKDGDDTVQKTVSVSRVSALYYDANGNLASSDQDIDIFTVALTPKASLGMVYQVVPGKFNLNVGTVVSTKYTWTTTEKTNSDIDTMSDYSETSTNGNTAVVSNAGTYTPATGKETKETKETVFSAAAPDATVYVGGTWFLTDKVLLDIDLATGNVDNGSLGWDLNVQFGFRF